jgi:hypothetical protein
MNSSRILNLTQLRKLFIMFKRILMQSLNIFRIGEGIYFVFQSLKKFKIQLEKFKPTRTHLSAAHLPFNWGIRYLDLHPPAILPVTTGDRAHCTVEAPVSVAIGDRRPLCASCLIPAPAPSGRFLRSHFTSSQLHLPLLFRRCLVAFHHRRPPPPSPVVIRVVHLHRHLRLVL